SAAPEPTARAGFSLAGPAGSGRIGVGDVAPNGTSPAGRPRGSASSPPTPYGPGSVVPSGRSPVSSSMPLSNPTGTERIRFTVNETGLMTGIRYAGVGSPGLMSRR